MKQEILSPRGRKQKKKSAPVEAEYNDDSSEDNLDSETADIVYVDDQWLAATEKEKERSRIQRQMKARRELERRRDEKRLRELVDDDWFFGETP
jgi:hypothetical protein